MKKNLLLFLGVLMNISLFSQGQLTVFQDWWGNAGTQNFFYKNVTKTDASGNVYVAGATINGSGTTDILVTKYNSSGVMQWTQQYNGLADYYDFATALALDPGGNVYITGAVSNDTLHPTTNTDVILIKYNSSGVQQWVSTYDGSAGYFDSGTDLYATSGGIAVSGSSMNSSFNMDYVTIAYNSSGVQLWAGIYDHSSHLNDVPVKISRKGASIIVAGAVQTGAGTYNWAIVQYNNSGTQTGVTTSSGGASTIDSVFDMMEDVGGNIYIGGATLTATHGYDYDLVKLDSNLVIQWEKTYDGAGHLNDMIKGLKVDAAGNVYVTGLTTTDTQGSNYLTQKYNSAGILLWSQIYNDSLNGDDEATAIVLDHAEENIYVTGFSDTDSLNGINYYTIKYDTSGIQQWAIAYDGDKHLHDRATNIALDTTGNVIVTGESETAAGIYEYITLRYVEKDIIAPADYSSEKPQTGFGYFENKGQLLATDSTLIPDIKYYSKSMEPALYFKSNSYSMVFAHADTSHVQDTLHRIDITYHQANLSARTYALEEEEYFNNYYLGHIPQGITEVHSNKRLITTNLYSNIDVEYSSNQNGFKYYFIIKPGALPTTIKMEYTGASSFDLDGITNALTINSSVGNITYARPIVYQLNSSNVIIPVTGWMADWQTNSATNKYKFNVGSYDSTKTLIIMVNGISHPTAPAGSTENLCWSSYIGGGSEDYMKAVDTDLSGNLYLAGTTFSFDFPLGTGAFQTTHNAGYDAVLLKFRPSHLLQWGTFLGGSNNDSGNDVKVRKPNGNPYLVGHTPSSDFPKFPKAGAFNDTAFGGSNDGFIAEFVNVSGFAKWITYFGAGGNDQIQSLDFDSSNHLFIAGSTTSSTGITSLVPSGAYTQSLGGSSDAFIARFTATDNYDWYTPYGGSGADLASDIKTDHSNNIFILGETASSNLPTTDPTGSGDYYDNSRGGTYDAFIAKFSPAGVVQWATYIGGDSVELTGKNSLAFNSNNDIYVGGVTWSSNFPKKSSGGFFDNSFTGNDGFLMKFSGANYDTLWSTYISGNSYPNNLIVSSIAINGDDEVFVGGGTSDASFPVFQQGSFYYQDVLSGAGTVPDGYLLTFDQWEHEILGTYFGGYELGYQEKINDMTIINNYLYVAGQTFSSDTNSVLRFPLHDPGFTAYYDSTYNGGIYDGFVSMFCIGSVVGIQESNFSTENTGFIVYPNPASGLLNIMLKKAADQNIAVELYSIDGKLVNSYTLLKHQELMSVDISSLSQGLYLLRIQSSEFNSTVKFSKN